MRIAVVALSFSALLLCPTAGQAQEGDAEAGATVFKKCSACHVVDKDQNRVGPSLMGVIGRTAGTHANFKYSKAMVDAGKNGLVWDEAALNEYLRDPKAKVKGTKMVFPGLKKDDEIANVIAYLKQHPK
ncbi:MULTISPECIES: c-type cytochrome [Sinorhizobium]|uniref:Cytochrome C n=2 Tax=Sinorhizobium TaxID=28105 RepID=A0A2S3YLY2_9HYPH|nr:MULTISPECIES: cytochrome c family protein [Sinorhizobium]ASY57591.1 Cytochrome c2 [Sinorhizobium sp. CCBAU 05631]AUX77349.1 cytochrome-c class 1 protein [Sinorhizobium fredii]PDT42125.1 cytochrome c family protein [Sinorhizobium sp. FG01]PDT54199.1 cytochrome c family protein [Sinorhizobium sp. NG07B]POH30046.1 cytochrome C [Sinorhizobium americanum]